MIENEASALTPASITSHPQIERERKNKTKREREREREREAKRMKS
jgi:hypothetical protein